MSSCATTPRRRVPRIRLSLTTSTPACPPWGSRFSTPTRAKYPFPYKILRAHRLVAGFRDIQAENRKQVRYHAQIPARQGRRNRRRPLHNRHRDLRKNISSEPQPIGEAFLCLGAVPPTESDVYGTNLAAAFFDGDGSRFLKSSSFVDSSGFLGIGKTRAKYFEKLSLYPIAWGAVKNQFFAAVFTPEKSPPTAATPYRFR